MIIFSTVRSGSTYLTAKHGRNGYKNFDEILHFENLKAYRDYDGPKVCKIQSNNLAEYEGSLSDLFSDEEVLFLFPREDYVQQYLSFVLVATEQYESSWITRPFNTTTAEELFENLIVPHDEALYHIDVMSKWIQDWIELVPEILKYTDNYTIHRLESYLDREGKFWASDENKLRHFENPDAIIDAIHESHTQWNLSAGLNGIRELLT